MPVPTQTTSTGWFYADGESEHPVSGWDGRFWPEIVGYRGGESVVQLPPSTEFAPSVPVARPATAEPTTAESETTEPAISGPAISEIATAETATMGHIFAALAVILVVVALVLGVLL